MTTQPDAGLAHSTALKWRMPAIVVALLIFQSVAMAMPRKPAAPDPFCAGSLARFAPDDPLRSQWDAAAQTHQLPMQPTLFYANVLQPIFGPEICAQMQVTFPTNARFGVSSAYEFKLPGKRILKVRFHQNESVRIQNAPQDPFVLIEIPLMNAPYAHPEEMKKIFDALKAWTAVDPITQARIPTDATEWVKQQDGTRLTHDSELQVEDRWEGLSGAIKGSALSGGMLVFDAKYGWCRVERYEPKDGGAAVLKHGGTTIFRTNVDSHDFATSGSPAASALLDARSEAFAPIEDVALAYVTDFLASNGGTHWAKRSGDSGELSKAIATAKSALLAMGVRKLDPATSKELRRKLLESALDAYEKYGVDLVRTSLSDFLDRQEQARAKKVYFEFPLLGIKPTTVSGNAYYHEVRRLPDGLPETHARRLFNLGIEALAGSLEPGDPLLTRLKKKAETEASIGRGADFVLTSYFTAAHEKSVAKSDPFTELLKRVEHDKDSEAAATLARFAKRELEKRGVNFSDFDYVTSAPSSERTDERNRAFLLGKALVAETKNQELPPSIFKLGDDFIPQTAAGDLESRLRNANEKFLKVSDTRVKGKTILLVEDANTTGVGLVRMRELLYRAGAKKVVVLSFAQTVREGENPLPGLPSFPAKDF